ncbi:hypothetical protein HHK36_010129 [Tetracentron sinense]|uniref:Ribosomal protein L27 n=1 Tax=Tetracentron sinense TaxID=13715 RepID=A0A835DI62_TETSI|nr:hypothetical protein HHK36_010129 [Tetracentron sinense]
MITSKEKKKFREDNYRIKKKEEVLTETGFRKQGEARPEKEENQNSKSSVRRNSGRVTGCKDSSEEEVPGLRFVSFINEYDESCNNIMQTGESQRDDGAGGGLSLMFRRWATKKTAGSTKNGRDSKPKNLGVKKFGGERVIPGNIIVRQRGTRFHPGNYVGIGKDHTLYALKEGCVKFERHKLSGRKWVHIEPKEGHVLHPIHTSAATPKLKTTAKSNLLVEI